MDMEIVDNAIKKAMEKQNKQLIVLEENFVAKEVTKIETKNPQYDIATEINGRKFEVYFKNKKSCVII